ncbi:cytochrome c oxidase subunit 3 family protein [Geomonas sp. RF6]|uniref:cytochrome c oxidase subunit 3 family protein n=1 Tax=Geomonas sp. RF6 TaxID=2897342 RepID=UPI001E438457|nr:cytochrome c oxidase subunit 3 family protein [Geomonas sp. RF6]UFS69531.1 cytochrome c oxidase subunit 3 family protein [Geomonas sp. RF6]
MASTTDKHNEAPSGAHKEAPVSARLGIWTFLATELLLFGGLFTAYAQFRGMYPELFHLQHLKLSRPLGALNTVVLLTSSLTMAVAIGAVRRARQKTMNLCLMLTLALAGVFLVIKYIEWSHDFAEGIFPKTNIFWGLYFVMTGLHGLHVVGGMAVLAALIVLARKDRINAEHSAPVEVFGLYWHFVDLIWIYLFPLLYLIG